MGRFNKGPNQNPGPQSAVKVAKNFVGKPVRVRTALGAKGYKRETKSELLLLAVSFMGGDDVLHERSTERYRRLVSLCHDESVFTDEQWCHDFINYLRNDAQMRTVSIVIAVEIVRARLAHSLFGDPRNRQLVSAACSRADEPMEVLAYYTSRYGQSKWDNKLIPQPILAGVGDAAIRLWNEFSVLKYGGGGSKTVTMRDVLRLARPKPKDFTQAVLFGWITGTLGEGNPQEGESLPMITARQKMNAISKDERISYLFGDSNVAR